MVKRRVEVEIFGQRYPLRSDAPEGYVREVAGFVDQKMREVAERTGAVSTLQVAILAALHIAEEYIRDRRNSEEMRKRLRERVERLEEFIALERIDQKTL
ncbi:MAG: cell division protein ZapA [Deltaproteobacteria bacterium]|nr:MAG: cell division protein ZapA [Deltaproteobacteria bacterium]